MKLIREETHGVYRWKNTCVTISQIEEKPIKPRAGYNRPKYKDIYEKVKKMKKGQNLIIDTKTVQDRERIRMALYQYVTLHELDIDIGSNFLKVIVTKNA